MFHSKTLNSKIDRLLDRALKIVYSELLHHKHKSFSIHNKNVRNLAVKICRFLLNLYHSVMNKNVRNLAVKICRFLLNLYHSVMNNIPSNYPL